MVIDASVPVEQARFLATGKQVVIDEPDLNIRGSGVISAVATNPGTNGLDGYHLYFQVRVVSAPPTVVQASVRLRVPIKASGRKVLAVPVTAVALGPDGSSRVEVLRDGGFTTVLVQPKLSAGGYVEVELLEGRLAPGDEVLVGYRTRDVQRG
jgi:multidrug efflux pump subunit AcrA (membrane-fusion protein)